MGFWEAWASVGKWNRRLAVVGSALILSAAAMTVDAAFLRNEQWKEYWASNQDQRWADELQGLIRAPRQRRRRVDAVGGIPDAAAAASSDPSTPPTAATATPKPAVPR